MSKSIFSKISDVFEVFSEIKGNCIFNRSDKKKNFTQICNKLIGDTSLSRDARFVMIYILSKPDDWTINETDICNVCQIGKKLFRKVFSELETSGFIKRYQFLDPVTKKFTPNYYLIDESRSLILSSDENAESQIYLETSRSTYQGTTTEGSTTSGTTLLKLISKKTDYSKTKTTNIPGKTISHLRASIQTVKNVVCPYKNKKLTEEQAELLEIINLIPGMNPKMADKLIEEYNPEEIKEQLKYLPFRDFPESQGKTFFCSVKDKWSPPGGYLKSCKTAETDNNKDVSWYESKKSVLKKEKFSDLFEYLSQFKWGISKTDIYESNRDYLVKRCLIKHAVVIGSNPPPLAKTEFDEILAGINKYISFDDFKTFFDERMSEPILTNTEKELLKWDIINSFLKYFKEVNSI
jgi:hypothetical protein